MSRYYYSRNQASPPRLDKFGGHAHVWQKYTDSHQQCAVCHKLRRDPNALHRHTWQAWGNDNRYERCTGCGELRRIPAPEPAPAPVPAPEPVKAKTTELAAVPYCPEYEVVQEGKRFYMRREGQWLLDRHGERLSYANRGPAERCCLNDRNVRAAQSEHADVDPRSVECPYCGAKAGQHCKRPSGHQGPAIQPHAARVKHARHPEMAQAMTEKAVLG